MNIVITLTILFCTNILLHDQHVNAHYESAELVHDDTSWMDRHHHNGHAEVHKHHHTDKKAGLRSLQSNIRNNQTSIHRHLSFDTIEHCGSRTPTATEFNAISKVVTKWMTNSLLRLNQVSTVQIDTYFHVITDGTNGFLTTDELQGQLDALNESFRPYGFSFRLLGTTTTENVDWFFAGIDSQEQTDMKKSLRVGDASTLNVYFNQPGYSGSGTLLGYATFPWEYTSSPEEDGVVLFGVVIPGGPFARFDKGLTLVHEVGHWLGLFHTFNTDFGFFQRFNIILFLIGLRNGCNSMGDDVRDTPKQRSASDGCPIGRDSCPLRPGLDPIANYMDYTDDACRSEFTPAQSDRMWALWSEYRAV